MKHRAIKVLLVDDDMNILQMTAKGLAKIGYEVETQSDASLAIAQAKKFSPDIMILDIDMPGVTGPWLAEKIKQDPVLKNTPFVFMSALITRDEAPDPERPNVYIAKPASIEEIDTIIRNYVIMG